MTHRVAGSVEGFIDLSDRGRYHYQLSAPIPPRHADGIWCVSLQDMVMEKMTGLAPYFATSPQSFFRPDRDAPRRSPRSTPPSISG